jgi:hypothetical protein
MRVSVDQLHSNLDHTSFALRLSQGQRADLTTLQQQVKVVKEALDLEYGTRLLRGYHSQWQRLLSALQPSEAGAFRLIAHPALKEGQQAGEQEDEADGEQEANNRLEQMIQTAAAMFAEQLRAILASTPAGERGNA